MSSVSTPEALAISLAGQCDRGKVRDENQGEVRHTSTRFGELLMVVDGFGSDAGGERASQIAVDTICSSIEGIPPSFPPQIAVEEAIAHANAAIFAAAPLPNGHTRMGATVVVALLRRSPDPANAHVQAIIGRMGDSRAYLNRNHKLTLLTRDDSIGPTMLDRNHIMPRDVEAPPGTSVPVRYLGKELKVRVEMRDVQLEIGDSLLLCSDGVWRYIPEQDIARELSDETRTVEEASHALFDRALQAGGHQRVAIEIARIGQTSDTALGVVCAEIRSEIPPQAKSVCGYVLPSDPPQPELPVTQVNGGTGESVPELAPHPKRKGVLSLIRDLGRRISDKESTIDESAIPLSAPASSAKTQPIVSWVTPEPIVYGTRLSSVQLNAVASIEGTFHYTPGPGYALPAGTHTLWATFCAAGQEDNPVLAAVPITVLKATPTLHWPIPAQMPPGVPLGAGQLNAAASVCGRFEYSPGLGEMLEDGSHTLSVTFVPEDEANYATVQAAACITIAKTVPNIQWVSPDPIPWGTPLAAAQLNASASIPGTFEYSPAAGEVLSVGSHTLSAIFMPRDDASYSRAEAMVSLVVTRATPTIAWPTPEEIRYGTRLSESQLNATASVPGKFVYTPGPGSLLSAGEHTPAVVFTPSNLTDYAPAQAAVSLRVLRKTPEVHWPPPEPIRTATPLGPTQLNAAASLPGSFAYTPANGESLGPGIHKLSVSFTPADCVNYMPAEASVLLTVTEISPANVTWPDPHPIPYGTALGVEQLNASCPIPGSFLYAPAAGEVLPAGKHKLSVIFTPRDEEKHAQVMAHVMLIVEELPNVATLLRAASQTQFDPGITPHSVAQAVEEPETSIRDDQPVQNFQRETRLYRGAVYAKGDDGQWHLQRK
jgi:serine/threonine protein phosphatase PrpC